MTMPERSPEKSISRVPAWLSRHRDYLVTVRDDEGDRLEGFGMTVEDAIRKEFGYFDTPAESAGYASEEDRATLCNDVVIWEGGKVVAVFLSRPDVGRRIVRFDNDAGEPVDFEPRAGEELDEEPATSHPSPSPRPVQPRQRDETQEAAVDLGAALDRLAELQAEYDEVLKTRDAKALIRFERLYAGPAEKAMDEAERRLIEEMNRTGRDGVAVNGRLYVRNLGDAGLGLEHYSQGLSVVTLDKVAGLGGSAWAS
jgi:hypothetical protein